MDVNVVSIERKFELIGELHKYKAVARMNEYLFKLVKMKREFIWHSHAETDEVFIIFSGEMKMELRDKTLTLKKGDMVSIPKGVEHKPSAAQECHVMLIEPEATVNTGDAGGKLTDNEVEWI
jgi:mannose-6-phosphate isomerase-like protein (cupin superfamily)